MDAFYASVELLRYPHLRGLPVVIGGRRRSIERDGAHQAALPRLRDYAGRGVITTATYEARAFGVHSGMGLMKAAALCPDALLLPADFDEYRRMSRMFKAAVAEIAPVIEDRGIDEIYIDLTDCPGVHDDGGHALGAQLKARVHERCGLTCSVGITPNKLLSKIASELDKPDGLTVLDTEDIGSRIWPLPARRINGIGPKASARLEALGIRTIGELAAAPPTLLIDQFGRSYGAWLHEAAHGRDERPVVTYSEPRSISRETTFEHDLHPRRDRERLSGIFTELCAKVADDLRRKGYVGRTIGIKLRYEDFTTVTRDQTLHEATAEATLIRAAAGSCLKRVPLERKLRLLGVRVGTLSRTDQNGQPARSSNDPVGSGARYPSDANRERTAALLAAEPGSAGQAADARQLPLFDAPKPPTTDLLG
jgi:DNA polymerase-4